MLSGGSTEFISFIVIICVYQQSLSDCPHTIQISDYLRRKEWKIRIRIDKRPQIYFDSVIKSIYEMKLNLKSLAHAT